MNTNALSVIDTAARKLVNTVLLDDVDLGAANPWGVACTADGKSICVTHAGTHELSVIDAAALHDKLAKVAAGEKVSRTSLRPEDVPNDLSFLVGLRRRIRLKGNGPRGLAIVGKMVYVARYFSDDLAVVDLEERAASRRVRAIALGPKKPMSQARKGEMLFHDAIMCFQHWQSCSSCHPDGRNDGLNWDLLNDGMGNPKNTKSMFLAHKTPPVMITGIRPKAEVAVRAGIKFILFAVRPEEEAVAIDTFLKSLTPVPSPYLVNGALSDSAKRGKTVFTKAKCASCHPASLYTNRKKYNIGTGVGMEKTRTFDTPTLLEVWRTGPYLYDGRAVTIASVLKEHNKTDSHGKTTKLSATDLKDLAEFVLSL
jgi:DNA-binding beta-propeller fold protein YncE